MSIAFVFPGQGAQVAGMGKDFYENSELSKEIFEKASQILNLDMKALCFEENDKLDITEYTQAALLTTSIAMWKEVEKTGLKPVVCAGLSLGEYCAMVAAGVMKFEDAVKVARQRGILMQEAVPVGVGAMCAVLGMEADAILKVCEEIGDVYIANYNCPGQIVISGKKEAVEAAAEKLKENGAKRCMMLNVSGPFHSPLLQGAGEKLADVLKEAELNEDFEIPYVTNVTAEYVTETKDIKEMLCKQVYSSVRWEQSVEKMLANGVDTFVEIGPGKTIAGFIRRINRDAKVINIQTYEDLQKLEELL